MDPDRRVLLVHFDFSDAHLPNGLWACPGGGLDPGESVRDGLTRELHEELGLVVDDPGDPIWVKEHIFPMSRWDGQHDTFFWVEVQPFDPAPQFSEAELRAEHLDGMRWWGYDELLRAQQRYDTHAEDRARGGEAPSAGDDVVFSPRRLGHLVRGLVERGRPAEPISVDPP